MGKSLGIDIRTLIVALWLGSGSIIYQAAAADIPECNGITSGTYIDNPRPDCEHSLIYCDEESSQFCDGEQLCDLTYTCGEDESSDYTESSFSNSSNSSSSSNSSTTTTISSSSSSSSSVSTAAPGSDVRRLCRRGVTQKYVYPGNCNYYYYCVDGYLVVEQCPIGYAYSEQLGTCSGRIADQQPRTCFN